MTRRYGGGIDRIPDNNLAFNNMIVGSNGAISIGESSRGNFSDYNLFGPLANGEPPSHASGMEKHSAYDPIISASRINLVLEMNPGSGPALSFPGFPGDAPDKSPYTDNLWSAWTTGHIDVDFFGNPRPAELPATPGPFQLLPDQKGKKLQMPISYSQPSESR